MQRFLCHDCGRRFCDKVAVEPNDVWTLYLNGKQTMAQIATKVGKSITTIKRRLAGIEIDWEQPRVKGEGVVLIDTTYLNRNNGLLVAIEGESGRLLYLKHVAHERVSDYEMAIAHLEEGGYRVKGVVVDGIKSLFTSFAAYNVQMCQFHFVALVRRKLTMRPQLDAAKELLALALALKRSSRDEWTDGFASWRTKWADFLEERTLNEDTGRYVFTHKRLRSAVKSAVFYLPYLFTFEGVDGMPNTNNKLEGTFTGLMNSLRNHSGMRMKNRRRFANGYFLEYAKRKGGGG